MVSEDNGFEALATASAKAYARKVVRAVRPDQTPKKSRRWILDSLPQHVLFLGGLASVVFGCFMIYKPLGPIVGGVIAVSLGLLLSTDTK